MNKKINNCKSALVFDVEDARDNLIGCLAYAADDCGGGEYEMVIYDYDDDTYHRLATIDYTGRDFNIEFNSKTAEVFNIDTSAVEQALQIASILNEEFEYEHFGYSKFLEISNLIVEKFKVSRK